jgi:hypothetical protein
LDLGGRPVGVHVQREAELEQLLLLVPVDRVGDLHRGRAGGQRQSLLDP